MTRYSVQLTDRIFVKGYGFLPFARNMGKNIGKNISKYLSREYNKKLLNHAKQSATNSFRITSKNKIKNLQKQLVI